MKTVPPLETMVGKREREDWDLQEKREIRNWEFWGEYIERGNLGKKVIEAINGCLVGVCECGRRVNA